MRNLIKCIESVGGSCYLVGGAVIDQIQGNPVKDWDIEVFGLDFTNLKSVLDSHGYLYNEVGASFGILKLTIRNMEIDLSVPRRENKIGKRHKDFEVQLDPYMTSKEAGRRRDLTINSMSQCMRTGEIIDPFNGLRHLKLGLLCATDKETFIEDPLRVLRIMQLLPRKGKTVHHATIKLCRSMVWEYDTLPKERVFEEFVKLLMKSDRPSIGLDFLSLVHWLRHFPELEALQGCQQHPEHHPEGDVWVHTLKVLDCAANYKSNLPEEWQLPFMFAALLHDVGKPVTTNVEEGWTAYGHDAVGEVIAHRFMKRLTNNNTLITRVCALVKCHMRPGQLTHSEAKISGWRRLHNKVRLDVVGYLSKADSLSRFYSITESLLQDHSPSQLAFKYFEEFGIEKIEAILMGRHLIEKGHAPGPGFKVMLDFAYELQLEGETDVESLYRKSLKKI